MHLLVPGSFLATTFIFVILLALEKLESGIFNLVGYFLLCTIMLAHIIIIQFTSP